MDLTFPLRLPIVDMVGVVFSSHPLIECLCVLLLLTFLLGQLFLRLILGVFLSWRRLEKDLFLLNYELSIFERIGVPQVSSLLVLSPVPLLLFSSLLQLILQMMKVFGSKDSFKGVIVHFIRLCHLELGQWSSGPHIW